MVMTEFALVLFSGTAISCAVLVPIVIISRIVLCIIDQFKEL